MNLVDRLVWTGRHGENRAEHFAHRDIFEDDVLNVAEQYLDFREVYSPRYRFLGRVAKSGRLICVILELLSDGGLLVVTARDISPKERDFLRREHKI
ncbi:MAG: hypothetical protein EXR67_07595 [Dehalococcoidia bacterium]|nr:hypothetical protein [Dehalococcoidia bacterium]